MREHKAMFDAAVARDAEGTKQLLEQHIANGLTHTLEAMDWSNRKPADRHR